MTQSGGENYDSRFCYMGATRFDALQEQLPLDVAILGIDAYTAICFDPNTNEATVTGQGGITLIGDGEEQRFMAGTKVPFDTFHASHRETVHREAPAQPRVCRRRHGSRGRGSAIRPPACDARSKASTSSRATKVSTC